MLATSSSGLASASRGRRRIGRAREDRLALADACRGTGTGSRFVGTSTSRVASETEVIVPGRNPCRVA